MMRTLIEIIAAVAILATAVIYGTDVFGAIVQRPAIAAVDDRTLTQVMGHIHRVADRRLAAFSIGGLIAAAVTAALAAAHPRLYEAMFSLPSGLPFAVDHTPEPLQRAFRGILAAFPDADGTRAEVAWSTWHGLATLQASGRLRASAAQARLDLVHSMLTQEETQ